ncbi:MAG: acyltransferase [Deltaproteobacteria bacterium]|nr:acyltransferase [Deltaproteobacteria bacterium]
MEQHPGLEIHPSAASALASATFNLSPGARVSIGPGVVTERRAEGVRITVATGGVLEIGADTWLRSELAPVIFHVYAGAHLRVGVDGFLNGCQISAKSGVVLGRGCWVGPGSRIWDSDQHAIDETRPEESAPVHLGDHVWVAADVSVLRGVEIGSHSVIGTRSLVTRSIPANSLAFGVPARRHSEVGDRSQVPI